VPHEADVHHVGRIDESPTGSCWSSTLVLLGKYRGREMRAQLRGAVRCHLRPRGGNRLENEGDTTPPIPWVINYTDETNFHHTHA
jgi:hypothetical protein